MKASWWGLGWSYIRISRNASNNVVITLAYKATKNIDDIRNFTKKLGVDYDQIVKNEDTTFGDLQTTCYIGPDEITCVWDGTFEEHMFNIVKETEKIEEGKIDRTCLLLDLLFKVFA